MAFNKVFHSIKAIKPFMRKERVDAKFFCPRGQPSLPSPHVDKHGFFGSPTPPLLSTWFMDAALLHLSKIKSLYFNLYFACIIGMNREN